MKIPIILGLIGLVLGQGFDTCEQTRFQFCTIQLGTYWNTDMTNFWSDLGTFDRVLQSLVKQPYIIDNYVNICNGFANFYACLGADNINNCLGMFGMVGMGNSPPLAFAYEGLLSDWGFKCGVGFFAVYESANFTNCTQSTFANYQPEMSQLITSYYQNVTADKDNVCTYAQNLMNGIGRVYETGPCRSVPGLSDRAFWYGCQSIRQYTNAQFWHCFTITKCPIVAPSMPGLDMMMDERKIGGGHKPQTDFKPIPKNFKPQGEFMIDGYSQRIGDKVVHHDPQLV